MSSNKWGGNSRLWASAARGPQGIIDNMGSKADTKARCVNCHFFVHPFIGRNADPYFFSMSEDARKELRQSQDLDDQGRHGGGWACYHGVWDEGAPFDEPRPTRKQVIFDIDRKDSCFFWPYHSNMNLIAATELQRREAANKEASIDRQNALKGVRIAFWALVITSVIQLVVAAAMINTIKRAVFFSPPVQWLLHLVGIV